MKNLGLIDNTQEKLTNEVKKMFLKNLNCLKKVSVFLSVVKGKRQTLMPKTALAEIMYGDVCISEEYEFINTVELYEHFQLEIADNRNREIDISKAILQMLNACLLYIINQLRGELEALNVNEFFDNFNIAKTCICSLSTTNMELSENIQQLVTHWISDLFKIITAADKVTPQIVPKDLKVSFLHLLKKILVKVQEIL